MKDGPPISRIAALIGDPARANMLSALMNGSALTASELALEAGVTQATASSHLAKLLDGGLLHVTSQGRHRYFALAGPDAAAMLEAISAVAATRGPRRVRPGPRDAAMREARVCYDHLAGSSGVAFYDSLLQRGLIRQTPKGPELSAAGDAWFSEIGIDVAALGRTRRPICKACLDWSERRSHLAGALGAAMFDHIVSQGWARRDKASRVVCFTPPGRRAFEALMDG